MDALVPVTMSGDFADSGDRRQSLKAIVAILAGVAIASIAGGQKNVDHLARGDEVQRFFSLGGAVDELLEKAARNAPPITSSRCVGSMEWQCSLMKSQSGRPATCTRAFFQNASRRRDIGVKPVIAPFSTTGFELRSEPAKSVRSGPCTISGQVFGARPTARSRPFLCGAT